MQFLYRVKIFFDKKQDRGNLGTSLIYQGKLHAHMMMIWSYGI